MDKHTRITIAVVIIFGIIGTIVAAVLVPIILQPEDITSNIMLYVMFSGFGLFAGLTIGVLTAGSIADRFAPRKD